MKFYFRIIKYIINSCFIMQYMIKQYKIYKFLRFFINERVHSDAMTKDYGFYLEYLPINFSIIAQDKSTLPAYLGSTLRGAIGHVLRIDTEACHYLYDNRRLDKKRKEVLKEKWCWA